MRKITTAAVLLAASIAAPSAVLAADAASYDRSAVSGHLPGYVFTRADTDHNGVIEGQERQRLILLKHNDQLRN